MGILKVLLETLGLSKNSVEKASERNDKNDIEKE
jgi:hypothetical protein